LAKQNCAELFTRGDSVALEMRLMLENNRYVEGASPYNVARLILAAHSSWIPMYNAFAVIIARPATALTAETFSAAAGPRAGNKMQYHVVLEQNGKIYDFDFPNLSGVPRDIYYEKMFDHEASKLVLRKVPALLFFAQMNIPIVDQVTLQHYLVNPFYPTIPMYLEMGLAQIGHINDF
jgi:hypothetical protein